MNKDAIENTIIVVCNISSILFRRELINPIDQYNIETTFQYLFLYCHHTRSL